MKGFDVIGEPGTPRQGWRKSSRTYGNGNCVEVAGLTGDVVGVRDSKNPRGHVLRFPSAGWQDFLGGIRNGEFDLLRSWLTGYWRLGAILRRNSEFFREALENQVAHEAVWLAKKRADGCNSDIVALCRSAQ